MGGSTLGDDYLRACQGDRGAAESLVSSLTPLVISTVRRAGVATDSIEDVASMAWLKLFDACGTLKEPDAVAGWLRTTAYNQSMEWHRAQKRRAKDVNGPIEDLGVDEPGFELVEESEITQQRRARVRTAMAELDERCRKLLALKVQVPKLTNREIGDRLGMALGSVAPTHGRCMEKLRTALTRVAS